VETTLSVVVSRGSVRGIVERTVENSGVNSVVVKTGGGIVKVDKVSEEVVGI
jgi:hypothetical protein